MVDLTARQQNVLAELATIMRTMIWDMGRAAFDAQLIDKLWDWADRFNVSPQDMDVIYDLMHRTGANQR